MNINDTVYIKLLKINGTIKEIKTGNDGTTLYLVEYKNGLNQNKYIKCNEHGLTAV
jgi:hypothetical protein